jgi:chromosome segregation ATPase
MSLSIDYGKMDQVLAFASFLEVLGNPQQFQAMIQDYKKVADEARAIVETKTKVNEVDAYVARAKADATSAEEALAMKQKGFDKFREEEMENLRKRAAEVARLSSEATELRADAATQLQEAEAHNAKAKQLEARLEAETAAVVKLREQLEAEKVDLETKQEQLKKLFG